MRRWLLFALALPLLGCPPSLNPDPVVPGLDDDDVAPVDDDDTVAQPYVLVEPDELDFGVVEVGIQATGEVQVSNNGTGDLQIQSIVFSNTDLFALVNGSDFDVLLAPDESTELIVGFTPQWNGEVTGTMVVATDDPIAPEVTVTLQGIGVAGELYVEPASYDFGPTPIGCERTLDVSLANVGAPTLTITGVDFEDVSGNGELSLHHDLDFPLLVGAAIYILEVRYLPTDLEPDIGNLSVYANDSQGSPLVVNQYGQGSLGAEGADTWTGDGSTATFTPSATPVPDTLEVSLNSTPIYIGWSWDAAGGAIVFDAEHIPADGDTVAATYTVWGCVE